MRTLSLAAALLALFSGCVSLSGCVAQELVHARQNVAKAQSRVALTKTPLFQAAVRDDRAALFPLLAKEVQVQTANPEGRDLMVAILEGRTDDGKRLAENGADVKATVIDSPLEIFDGYTALHFAAWSDKRDLVKLLVAKGADLDSQGKNGVDPMILARTPAMAGLLIDLGRPVDKEYKGGATALSSFAILDYPEIVRLLISRGADAEKARAFLANHLRGIEQSEYASSPGMQQLMVKDKNALDLLERRGQSKYAAQAAPQTAAGGVTKDELKQMMKEAAAENARPAAPVQAAPEYKSDVDAPSYKVSPNPDAFALVVGVEKYNSLPDARFAERDARAMNAHLLAMGYPQRNIVLLTGPQATKTGLIKNLEAWLPNNVTEKSTVMFYFSGHGAPDAKTSQAYLVPTDGDPQYLEETAYPMKRLYAKLAALKAKRVLVALDSCFSGAGGRSVLAQGTRPLVAKLEVAPVEAKVVSLSASSSEEITGALEDQGHGLFTYHLLKALTETAGRGSVAEVYASLKPRVQDEARRQNRAQTPQAFGVSLDGSLR